MLLIEHSSRMGDRADDTPRSSEELFDDHAVPASDQGTTIYVVVADKVIVIHEGGTPWWIPLAVGLGIALVAAVASYAAAWWFKKRDTDRENAFRAVDLVDQAEQLAARNNHIVRSAREVLRLLQEARIRAQPLDSKDLDDRFRAAFDYLMMDGLWQPNQPEPVGARWWMSEAVANIREGLVPYLAAPRFLPFQQPISMDRSFPTLADIQAMPHGVDGNELTTALREWKEARVPPAE